MKKSICVYQGIHEPVCLCCYLCLLYVYLAATFLDSNSTGVLPVYHQVYIVGHDHGDHLAMNPGAKKKMQVLPANSS